VTEAVVRIIGHLNELIEALDRRLPRLDGPDELDIARDAAALRDKALQRIRELEDCARTTERCRPRPDARPPAME